jgi:pyruvate/2-oxoglutarate/acetoin dehydrogenase E1 component
LAAIRSSDPVIFFEPKALYRAATEEVVKRDLLVSKETYYTKVSVVKWVPKAFYRAATEEVL